jgi:hypothetical protein
MRSLANKLGLIGGVTSTPSTSARPRVQEQRWLGVHRAIGKYFLLRLFEHNRLSDLTNELVARNHPRFSVFWSGLET